MKKRYLFLLIAAVSILCSISYVIFLERSRVLQVNAYPADVKVTTDGIIGINIDGDALHFGSIAAGSVSRRLIQISQVEEDAIVIIYKKGQMSEWLSYPNNFLIKKGEEKNITFTLALPKNAYAGNYTGEVVVVLRKP